MLPEDKYFDTLTESELWQRYCGFLDLSVEEWMDIQNQLLMEEIDLIADSTLGRKVMGKRKPNSPDEFRKMVPLTTYDDYEPYLTNRDESALAIKPKMWCHSSGKTGNFKWCPLSKAFLDRIAKNGIALMILSSTTEKGRINIKPGVSFLTIFAPAPYTTGVWAANMANYFSFKRIPNPQRVRGLEFQDRMRIAFQEALDEGIELIAGLASVIAKIGEQFTDPSQQKIYKSMISSRKRSHISAKSEKPILPKDLWMIKGIITSGMDTAIYKDAIMDYWGTIPYEFYVCTEAYNIAMPAWNRKDMTFLPDMAFLEFIPYEELVKEEEDKDYQPSTILLDQLEAGKLYEVVITNFYGGPLLRFRMQDIIKITSLSDSEADIKLPQMVFQRRSGDIINLAGLATLDEKTLWSAITNTSIKYNEWTAFKEYDQGKTYLRICLELKEKSNVDHVSNMINEQLKLIDIDYRDIEDYLKEHPIRVTLLSLGTFERYAEDKKKEGVDLAHLKPPHINPPEAVIRKLIQFSEISSRK